ncbi:hypothetical protein AAFF_G00039250 [Aldrovandia affinis]|uniref:Polyhomeotic-like protein 3 n=1 Tax=Aldrovandia affinis TaxID=143900 RepID=A0AAD7S2T4_9TELE|nr:hypothetical protein AAFF_G00039250 [Aldrovandia affinis]
MYLRAQMLILTPAGSVGVAQPDLPVFSSASSRSLFMQEQSLIRRSNAPIPVSIPFKASSQKQALTPLHHRIALCTPDPRQQLDTPREGGTDRSSRALATPYRHITPGPRLYSPVQSHTPMMQKLHCTLSQKAAHPQKLMSPKPAGGDRQVQSVSLQAGPLETPLTSQLCPSNQTPVTYVSSPTTAAVQSQRCTATPTLPLAPSKQSESAAEHKSVGTFPVKTPSPTSQSPAAVITRTQTLTQSPPSDVPEAPPLQLIGPAELPLHDPPHKPPALTLASSSAGRHSAPLSRAAESVPSQPASPCLLRTLSLVPTQGLAGRMPSSGETPAAEVLVQMLRKDRPSEQTVTEDLPARLAVPSELPMDLAAVYQMVPLPEMDPVLRTRPLPEMDPVLRTRPLAEMDLALRTRQQAQPVYEECPGTEEMKEQGLMESPSRNRTQTLSALLPPVERTPPPTWTTPLALANRVQSSWAMPLQHTPPGSPFSLPGGPESKPPQAIVKPQVLTHLIEGFVIQEGLEPFPVNRSSLMVEQQDKLPDAPQEVRDNGVSEPLMDTEHPWNSADTDVDDVATDDGMEEVLADVLHCEFCGKRGYAHTFLRSNRFCSTTCVRRFNVSDTKRISTLKANRTGRWARGMYRRRGRRPSRLGGSSRAFYLRQVAAYSSGAVDSRSSSWRSLRAEEEEEEEEPPVPMTTRLRRQAELERERKRKVEEVSDCGESPPTSPSSPRLWTVDQVCAFVHTLPGCQDVAKEFRSQEIDGQALLLLSEEHLVTTMNIRLGPALKICARINSLKDP